MLRTDNMAFRGKRIRKYPRFLAKPKEPFAKSRRLTELVYGWKSRLYSSLAKLEKPVY